MEIVKNNSSILITCNTDDFTQVNNIWRADITGINRYIYQYYTCRIQVYNRASSLDDRVSVTIPNKITKTVNAADNKKWYNLDGFDTNRLSLAQQTIFLDIYFDPNKTYGGSMVEVEFATDNSSIYCYNNNVEDIRVFKGISNLFHLTGIFRDNIDLINPTFEIEYPEVPTFNYVFLNMFGRYYFVDSIECVRNGLYRIYCSIDVLMSYNEQLPDLQVYVTRQENTYNEYLPDEKLPSNSKTFSQIYEPYQVGVECRKGVFILAVASSNTSFHEDSKYVQIPRCGMGVNYYLLTTEQVYKVMGWLLTADFGSEFKIMFENPSEAILSLKYIPFVHEGGFGSDYGISSTLAFGNITHEFKDDIGNPIKFKILHQTADYDRVATIKVTLPNKYSKYKYYLFEPYSNFLLYLPYYGFVEIDPKLYYKDFTKDYFLIDIWCCIDGVTGKVDYMLYNDENQNYKIQSFGKQIGFELPISHTNRAEISRNILTTSLSAAASVGSLIGSFFGGSPKAPEISRTKTGRPTKQSQLDQARYEGEKKANTTATITKIPNMVSNITLDYINSAQSRVGARDFSGEYNEFYVQSITRDIKDGTWGDEFAYPIPIFPFVLGYFHDVNEPTGYAHIVGRPSDYSGRLGDLTGYTEVGAFHLEGINGITTEEKDLLEKILRSGVIM